MGEARRRRGVPNGSCCKGIRLSPAAISIEPSRVGLCAGNVCTRSAACDGLLVISPTSWQRLENVLNVARSPDMGGEDDHHAVLKPLNMGPDSSYSQQLLIICVCTALKGQQPQTRRCCGR